MYLIYQQHWEHPLKLPGVGMQELLEKIEELNFSKIFFYPLIFMVTKLLY